MNILLNLKGCKLYDAALTQYVYWHELNEYGGLEHTLSRMREADDTFVMGLCLKIGLDLIGTSTSPSTNQPYLANNMNELNKLSTRLSPSLTDREVLHIEAINELFKGNLATACDCWETILIDNPTDMQAIKFAHDTYFYLGKHPQMRDSIARVLPYWPHSLPMYSTLHGLHSFGLVQTSLFEAAKTAAQHALHLNRQDAWATHTICHYHEYTNDFNAGIRFLRDTEADWSVCNLLSSHNYWHLALYHIERQEHDAALDIFDKNISPNLVHGMTLDMVDAISLLFRLKLDFYESSLSQRWSDIADVFSERASHHGYLFNDAHVLMMLLNRKGDTCNQLVDTFFNSLNDYLNLNGDMNGLKRLNERFATKLFRSIAHFEREEYAAAFEALYPIRYELVEIGGSNAQRDMFQQLLIQSALKSESKMHNKIGQRLINERLALKPNSNLAERLALKFQ